MIGDRWVKILPSRKRPAGVTIGARGKVFISMALDDRLGSPDSVSVFVAGKKLGLVPHGEVNICRTKHNCFIYATEAIREAGLKPGERLELTDIDDGIFVLEKT